MIFYNFFLIRTTTTKNILRKLFKKELQYKAIYSDSIEEKRGKDFRVFGSAVKGNESEDISLYQSKKEENCEDN